MGFKDGTNNIRGEDANDLRRFVWLGTRDRPRWMRGGTWSVERTRSSDRFGPAPWRGRSSTKSSLFSSRGT